MADFFDEAFRSTTADARGAGATQSKEEPPWPIADHASDAVLDERFGAHRVSSSSGC